MRPTIIALAGALVVGCGAGRTVSTVASSTPKRQHRVYTGWPYDDAEATRRQAETAKMLGLPTETSVDLGEGVQMSFVLIPAGEFVMGRGWGMKDAMPPHKVRLTSPIYFGKHEVTQAQYESVMETNPSKFKGAQNPVETVLWADAVEFCARLSRQTGRTIRLPTEAEWEHACRAGAEHGTGPHDSTKANFNDGHPYGGGSGRGENRGRTVPVGSFPARVWGLHDMHGNVLEWCSDWYDAEWYTKTPLEDPTGPTSGEFRVARGGSWKNHGMRCGSEDRFWDRPDAPCSLGGFRVVMEIPEPN